MTYRKPTIQEEGGLQVHLEKEGIDWSLFLKLDKANISNNAIGRVLGKSGRTISNWRDILEGERNLA